MYVEMKNIYKQYDGNSPVIFGTKGLNPKSLSTLQTGAPYMGDKLYQLKTQVLTSGGYNPASIYAKMGTKLYNIEEAKRNGQELS